MFGTFVVVMALFISSAESTPRAPYIDFFTSMSDGPIVDSHNDPALAGIDNSSTPAPMEGVSTTLFPEDFPTYSPDASKSMQPQRQRNRNPTGSMSEQPRESLSATEGKGQFSLMDVNTWDSIPTAFFEPVAPSVSRGSKSGAPNQGGSSQNPISFSEAGAEPSLSWDYSSVGMGGGAEIGSGGTQDVFLPLADHSPGSMQADQPVMASDWSAPPVSKDTAKYREEPTPKPVNIRFSDGESMARAILTGQVKRWEWTYSATLGAGSSSGQGDRYDKSLTCCQRLPYICGVDGMCVIGIDECQEFCTCAANPQMPHCQKIIPIIKRTMAALEKKILAKVAKDLTFTTTTTTTARVEINRYPAAGYFNPGITDLGQFMILGAQSAARATQARNPMETRTAAEATRKPAATTRFQPSAVPQSRASVVHFQSTHGVHNIINIPMQNSQIQHSVNTKSTIPAGAILDSKQNSQIQHSVDTKATIPAGAISDYKQNSQIQHSVNTKATIPAGATSDYKHNSQIQHSVNTKATIPAGAMSDSKQNSQIQHSVNTKATMPAGAISDFKQNSQIQHSVNTKVTIPAGAISDSKQNSQIQHLVNTKATIPAGAVSDSKTSPRNQNALAATSDRRYPQTTATPSPKSVKILLNSSTANLKATQSHPASLSKNGVTSRGSMTPTQAPTTGVRKPQNPTAAGLKPKPSPRNSKLPFTVDPDAVPTTKTTLLSPISINASKTRTNSPPSRGPAGSRTQNHINNSQSMSPVTYTAGDKGLLTNGTGVHIHAVGLQGGNVNTKSDMHSKEKKHTSLGDSLVATSLNITKQRMYTGRLSNITRTSNADRDTTTARSASGTTPRNTGINTGDRKNIISRDHVSSSRPHSTMTTMAASTTPRTQGAVPFVPRKHNDDNISSTFTSRIATVEKSTTAANIRKAPFSISNGDRPAISRMRVDGQDFVKSASHDTIGSPLTSRITSVRTSTTTDSTERASISVSNRGRPAIARMHVGGNDSTGNDSTGNDSIGNNSTGNNSAGNHSTGNNSAGNDSTGNISTGKNSTGNNSAGNDSTGNDSTGNDSTGNNSTGNDSTGNNSTGNNSTGINSTGNNSTGKNSVKAASNEAISFTFKSRITSVGASTTTASVKKTSISVSNRDRLTIARMHVGDNDPTGNNSTGNESTYNDPTGNESTYNDPTGNDSTGNDPTGNDPTGNNFTGNDPTGNNFTGNDPTGNDPTGNDPTGNDPTGNNFTGNDSTGNNFTGNDPTGNDSTGNDPTGNDPTGNNFTGNDPTGNDPTGNNSTGNNPTGNDPTGNNSTGNNSTGNDPTGNGPIGNDPTGNDPTGNDSTGNDPTGNDSIKSASYKELLQGSTIHPNSGNPTAAVDNTNFKSSTMPTAKISNMSREPAELVRSNNGGDRVETFPSFLGNSLRYNGPLSTTGLEFVMTTSLGPKTTVSTSNILVENTTPTTVGSTSGTDQEASAFIHLVTTSPTVTSGVAAVSDLRTLNGTTEHSNFKTNAMEKVQLVARAFFTHEPPQDRSTGYSHSTVNDRDEELRTHTSSSTTNYTNRTHNDTSGQLATDKDSLENNFMAAALNEKDTILKNNVNLLTDKETTQAHNNTLDIGDESAIDVSLPGMTTLPANDKVHTESGKSSTNIPNTIVNGNVLEYDPSLTTTPADGSEIQPCSDRCQGNGGVCVLGDDLKSHCVIVSEVCHQHLCVNGYCVSSDGIPACECHGGWLGASCDQPCPVACDDRSFCEGIGDNDILTCACRWNYTGPDCSSTRKVVQPTPDVVYPSGDLETWEVAIVAVVTAVAAALLCVASLYLLWKKQWLPMRQLCFFFLPYEDDDEKDFDAFISYQASPRDERFVVQHLGPKLEKEFDFRLCLPTRDFIPGESTSSNTIRAVKNSRRTVLILSQTYVSEWSKDEYFKAKQEILKLKHKVIPVVLEDLSDPRDFDPFFRSFVDSVYAIKWPGEDISSSSSSISKFWKLLELSMPKKRNRSNVSVSSSGLYSSDLSTCSKTRFSSNSSSIYEEIIYSPTLGSQNGANEDGNSGQKTMQMRKPMYSLIGNNSFPDLPWYHQGRLSAGSLTSPQESRSISSLSDDTGIEINTRSNSISSGIRVCPNHVVNIQEGIPRVHSVLGPVPRVHSVPGPVARGKF